MRTIKKTVSVLLICAIVLAFSACKKTKKISAEDFTSKLENELFTISKGGEEASLKTWLVATYTDPESRHLTRVTYFEYISETAAQNAFDSDINYYKRSEKAMKYNELSFSSHRIKADNGSTYTVEVFVDDMIIEVCGSDKSKVKSVLSLLGY